MIILFLIDLLLALLFSLGVLALVITLTFREPWKTFTGVALCGAIFLSAVVLSYRAAQFQHDGAELSRLVEQAGLYLQKHNR